MLVLLVLACRTDKEPTDTEPGCETRSFWADVDGDGYGDPSGRIEACEASPTYVENGDDCDDTDPTFHPGAVEDDCNDPHDYNCDGSVGATDADNDGWLACMDCDDGDADVNPDAEEVCDDVDNDCDGDVDGDATDAGTWYIDADGDGHGASTYTQVACAQESGWVAQSGDCDDLNADAFPGAAEVCDEVDNDCDGDTDEDEAAAPTWYRDADGDGYGDAAVSVAACEVPSGHVADATDCDDGEADDHPGADEVCDGADNDCDGDTDEESAVDAPTWYRDDDGDGFGDPNSTQVACDAPSDYVDDDTDCDDTDEDVNPDAAEVCDLVDNDCDGDTDEDEEVLGDAAACAATDCAEVLAERSLAADAAYYIDPDGSGAFAAWCDMSTDGGGWTLVMKQASGSGYGSDLSVGVWAGWSTSGELLNETDATLADANMVNAAYSTLTATDIRLTASTTWVDSSSGAWTRTINDTPFNALSDANANQVGNTGNTETTPWSAASFTDHTWTSTTTSQSLCYRSGPWFNQTSHQYTYGGVKWGWFFNNECYEHTTDTAEGLGCCGNSSWYRASSWTLYLWAR